MIAAAILVVIAALIGGGLFLVAFIVGVVADVERDT